MAREGKRHILAAPVVTATAPLLRAGPLGLGRLAVVEKEAGIAFERAEVGLVREDERGADEGAGPVGAALRLAGVEQDEVMAWLGRAVIPVGGVEITDLIWRAGVGNVADLPLHAGERLFTVAHECDLSRFEKRHGEIAGHFRSDAIKVDVNGKRLHQVFGVGTIVESSRAEEESHGRIDGGLGPFIPRHAQDGSAKSLRIGNGNGKVDGPQDRGTRGQLQNGNRAILGHGDTSALAGHSHFLRFRRSVGRKKIAARSID